MNKQFVEPIDKVSLLLIFILSLVIGGLVWGGKTCSTDCFFHIGPRVRDFSWHNRQVGAEDRAFILTFDRPMDKASVEKNLVIKPPLPGRISWAGRRMAYTVDTPVPYGENYQIYLQGAKERFSAEEKLGALMQPFVGQFYSRDRAFAYIGTQGQERGRIILYNLTENRKSLLTPPTLVVTDFQFYPKGEQILFSATEQGKGIEGLRKLQLYRVTTGLNADGKGQPNSLNSAQKIELILDNQDYQNNQFDLSPDGQTIVVQRINRKNPADFDLWMIKPDVKPERLNVSGGEFLIAPDSQTLAVAKGEGIGIIPLRPDAQPLDFLPKFGKILSFSRDGSAAAMVNFNTDNAKLRYLRSLFYVNNQGIKKDLLNIQGSILDCQFNPSGTNLYCLLTQLVPGEEYREQPYFAKIDLKTSQVVPLVALPEYQDIKVSMAADGLGILFDQVVTTNTTDSTDSLTANSGEVIIGGRLWLLIPPTIQSSSPSKPQLEELPLVGFRPQWVP